MAAISSRRDFGVVNYESDNEPWPDVATGGISNQVQKSATACAPYVPSPTKPMGVSAEVQDPIWFFRGSAQDAINRMSQKAAGVFAIVQTDKNRYKILFFEEESDFPYWVSSREFTVENEKIRCDGRPYGTMNGEFEPSGLYQDGLLDILNLEARQGINARPIFTNIPELQPKSSNELP